MKTNILKNRIYDFVVSGEELEYISYRRRNVGWKQDLKDRQNTCKLVEKLGIELDK